MFSFTCSGGEADVTKMEIDTVQQVAIVTVQCGGGWKTYSDQANSHLRSLARLIVYYVQLTQCFSVTNWWTHIYNFAHHDGPCCHHSLSQSKSTWACYYNCYILSRSPLLWRLCLILLCLYCTYIYWVLHCQKCSKTYMLEDLLLKLMIWLFSS